MGEVRWLQRKKTAKRRNKELSKSPVFQIQDFFIALMISAVNLYLFILHKLIQYYYAGWNNRTSKCG